MSALVFVYGTLTDRATAEDLLDTVDYRGPARLVGLTRVDGRYPTLAPGDVVEGRLLRTDDLPALDRYEGVADGLYVRVSLPFVGDGEGPATVETYVGDPDRLGVADEWPGDEEFETRVREYLRSTEVRVEPL